MAAAHDLEPRPCVAVAFSGGRDSTALLHAVACAARDANLQGNVLNVVALHVHHGLSPHADAWLNHAQATCDAWAAQGLPVRLMARRVQVPLQTGQGVEAEARAVRHQALHEMVQEAGADLLLLAHHRRDQAETLLLQALRGGGLAGLAAMPKDDLRDGVRWVRPWLDHPREAIEAYIEAHGLSHIEDDSNGDPRFARNRLRLQVWPALAAAFPQAEVGLANAASRLADALVPLRDWHAQALAQVSVPSRSPGASSSDDALAGLPPDQSEGAEGGTRALDATAWCAWSPAERRAALRHWYASVSGQSLSANWTVRLADELPRMLGSAAKPQAASGVWPALGLSLYRGQLRWTPPRVRAVMARSEARVAITLCIDAPGEWPLPEWGGVLQVMACTEGGVVPGRLRAVSVAGRAGGERFQAGPGRPPRALKKQFQMLGVPAWERDGPLFWGGGELLFVPGLGLDARCLADEGMPQWSMRWRWLDGGPASALKCGV